MMRLAFVCVLTLAATCSPVRAQDVYQKLAEVGIHVGGEVLKGIGSKLASEGLDRLWGKDVPPDTRVAELQSRLTAYEDGLRRVDAKSADQIAALRLDLSSRTTADDVRRIVNQTLASLEARTGRLAADQAALEVRVRQLHDLFGYLPTVTPAPLLVSVSEESGKPAAHPLMVEWLTLLLRSEESRRQIDELRRTRPDTSKVLQAALAKDRELLAETQQLHAKVMKELAGKLPERQALLEEFKRGTPEVRKFDENLSSVTWLAAVTRPVEKGPYTGRLAVPQALFGFDAPDVVRAFDVAKADRAQVVALYYQYLVDESTRNPFLGVSLARETLTSEMDGVGDEAVAAALRGFDLARRMQKVDGKLQAALKDFSEQSPEVQVQRREQKACMEEVRKLHQEFVNALKRGTRLYVEAMERERPSNTRMRAFRQGVLLPLASWDATTTSQETGVDSESWARMSGYGLKTLGLGGHSNLLVTVAWSPDGKRLATASWDKTARIWDAGTGKEQLSLTSHTDRLQVVAWSPGGEQLATGSNDRTAKIWDAGTGKELFTLSGHTGEVWRTDWSPDGKRLATACLNNDTTAKVWDAERGQEICTLSGHTEPVRDLAWSPDGKRLATAGNDDKMVRVWDAVTGRQVFSLVGAWSVAWSPDGKHLATGSHDSSAKIWDAGTGKELFSLPVHAGSMNRVAWSPDSKRLATASPGAKPVLKIWDAGGGAEICTCAVAPDDAWYMEWAPDGMRLATASLSGGDRKARVWDAATGALVLSVRSGEKDPTLDVTWSPDGKRLATRGSFNAILYPVEESITRSSQKK
jgi:WD40 repeat protein